MPILKDKNKIIKNHDFIIENIKSSLIDINNNIQEQKTNFYSNPKNKLYTGVRNDKGYLKWKQDVMQIFDNTCCICLSKDNLIIHHVYSYKYYEDLRTNINNGVCICSVCHENFHDLYSNDTTLKEFIEFREKYKGKKQKRIKNTITVLDNSEKIKLENLKKRISSSKLEFTEEQVIIIDQYNNLKQQIFNNREDLIKTYGNVNGVKILFRGKHITSKSAITQLMYEIMRINTLLNCIKIKDKTIIAKEFHMELNLFLEIIQNPQNYLRFTQSEISHLNEILSVHYKHELELIKGKEGVLYL